MLTGQVAIITGGSRGGMLKDIAQAYLQHSAKAVILMSRSKDKLDIVTKELSTYGTCIGISGDVRNPEDCNRVVTTAVQKFGRLDILVNGAAGNFLASASKLSLNGFKTVMEIDAMGTFNMSKAAYNGWMKANKGGVIINISAWLYQSGTALQIHSAAAKAAVDSMTKIMAIEWGPSGVRVDSIIPGYIKGTEGFDRLSNFDTLNSKEKAAQAHSQQSQEEKQKESETQEKEAVKKFGIPLLRFGSGKDIADAALFLVSPAASYISGSTIVVDGAAYLTNPNFPFTMPAFIEMWHSAKL